MDAAQRAEASFRSAGSGGPVDLQLKSGGIVRLSSVRRVETPEKVPCLEVISEGSKDPQFRIFGLRDTGDQLLSDVAHIIALHGAKVRSTRR